jgi:pimeloyl-ACP methyl ester carboxylesterase
MRPAVDGLARFFRVITFPLCGERECPTPLDAARGLDDDVAQVAAVLDERRIEQAIICGVSFGGLIALTFAARHPGRTRALVLASTPGPRWRLRRRHEIYARRPWLFGPLFLVEAPLRVRREIAATFPAHSGRWRFVRRQLRTIVAAPISLWRIAARARLMSRLALAPDCRAINCPALIVTGDRALDYVAPVDGTSEYVALIPGARHVLLERTGHLGTISRPDEFARIVSEFAATIGGDERPSRSELTGEAVGARAESEARVRRDARTENASA